MALNSIYNTVSRIYCDALGKHPGEIGEKDALDMLTEIEHRAMVFIEALGEYAKTDNRRLLQYEDD